MIRSRFERYGPLASDLEHQDKTNQAVRNRLALRVQPSWRKAS